MKKDLSTIKERFWSKTTKTDSCWLWTGLILNNGYGQITEGSRKWSTHRYSYVLHFGSIPEGHSVLHKCDVRNCVNPEHLFSGTQLANMHDMISKGRSKSGQASKTHCPRAHEYSEINTVWRYGRRWCRECARINGRQQYYRRKALAQENKL